MLTDVHTAAQHFAEQTAFVSIMDACCQSFTHIVVQKHLVPKHLILFQNVIEVVESSAVLGVSSLQEVTASMQQLLAFKEDVTASLYHSDKQSVLA